MPNRLTRPAAALALALAACAKQQPLPVANFVGIQQDALTVATGQQIILDGSNSVDPGGGELSYEWSFVSLPSGSRATIESPHNAITRFTPDIATTVQEKYVLSLVVRTRYFLSVPHLLTITSLDCGANRPSVDSITAAPTSINIATPVQLTAAIDDKDNHPECQPQLGNVKQTLRHRWALTSLPPGSFAALRDPAAVVASFNPDVAGTYSVSLVVTDSTGRASDAGRLDVQVAACGGAAPGINSILSSRLAPNLGESTQLTADVSDADNASACGLSQTLSYAWSVVALPTGSRARLNSTTALDPSFVPDVPGDYKFALVVRDSTGRASSPKTIDVIATNCGGAPPTPIVQFTPASAAIGSAVSLQVVPSDADGACGVSETFDYRWSLLTAPAGSTAEIAAPTASAASFIPDVGGDYAIAIRITDSNGTSATTVSHLAVSACGNNPPGVDALQALPLTPLVGQNVHVTSQVSDADSSCAGYNSAQTFRWTLAQRPAGSTAAIKDAAATSADFTPDVAGTYQVQLVVTDATGLSSAPGLLTVNTSTCGNAAPQILSVGASLTSPDPGTSTTLFAQTVDGDNGPACNLRQGVSLRWSVASRPAGSSAVLSNPAALQPAFVPDVAGSYQFSVVARDDTGRESAPAWLTIRTTSCGTGTPTVTANPAALSAAPFQPVQLSASPFDPDSTCHLGETFTYAWEVVSAPENSTPAFSNPAAPAPTFVVDTAGSYLLAVTVSDSAGHASAPSYVTVTATACAALAPVTGPLSATPAALGSAVTLSAPSARATACGAAAALSYAWSLSRRPPGSQSMLDDPSARTPGFVPDVAGSYEATLVVRDANGADSLPAVVVVDVSSCTTSQIAWSSAPELSPTLQEPNGSPLAATFPAGKWLGAFVGTRVSMNAAFVDPPGCGTLDVQPFTYEWSLVAKPAGSNAQLDSTSAQMPSFVPDVPGDYQVAARIGDATGAVLPVRFTTVNVASCGSNLPVASIAIAAPGTATPSTFQTVHLQVAGASDADNTSCPGRFAVGVTYAWSVSPAGPSLSPTTGTDADFTAGAPGTYTVQLVATASNGLHSVPATQVLTVGACGSHPPSIASVVTTVGGVAVSRPQVGQTVRVTASATDPDIAGCGDVISSYQWAVVSAPAGSTVSAPAAGSSFTFQADVAGTYRFTVVATDSFGLRSAPFDVALETATCSPVIASLTPSNPAPAIGETITLTPATPTDTCLPSPVFSYSWSIVSAPRGSVARLSSLTGSPVSFTPDVIGAYSFAVTATDQGGATSAPAVAQLNAGTCGVNAPTLAAIATNPANGTFSAGQVVVLSSALTDNNAACGAATQPYRWSWSLLSRPAGSHATLASSDAKPAFVPDLPGSYQVSAQVTDALGNVSQAVFATISTSPCGTAAPVAGDFTASQTVPSLSSNAGALTDFQIVQSTAVASRVNANVPFYAGVPIALSATYTDDDVTSCALTQTVAFSWSLAKAPAGSTAAILNPSSATPSLVPDLAGDYDVQLMLTDSTGRSTTTTFSSLVPVGPCGIQTPVARIAVDSPAAIAAPVSTVSIPIGSAVLLDGLPSHDGDIDQLLLTSGNTPAGSATTVAGCGLNQTLSYHWTVTAAPAAVQPFSVVHADLPNPSFTASVAGDYDLILTVSDGARSGSAPISVRARPVGSATVVATPANGSFVVGPDNGANIVTTVLDSDGNPMSGLPVSVAVTAGFTANTLAPSSGITGADGKFTALLTSTKAGNFTPAQTKNGETKTVQASSAPSVLGAVNVDFAPGAVHDIFWFVQPCDTPTGNVINRCGPTFNLSPEVDGEDQFGNVVTAYVSAVTLSVAQQPSGSTVNGTLTRPAGTPFDDLSVDTDGTYQLSASSGSFPSVLSNTFQGTPAPPNPPVITSSSATAAGKILVSWTGSQNNAGHNDRNVKQYHVFRATGVVAPPNVAFVDVGTVPSTGGSASAGTGCANFSTCGFLDSGLADGTQYTYYVEADTSTAAICTVACSNPSNTTSQFTMPAAVTNPSATTVAQKSIQLTWTLPGGTISTLDVRRSTSPTSGFSTFTGSSGLSGTTTTFTDTDNGKSTNTQYFYEIRSNITGATAPATNPSSVLSTRTTGFTLPDVPGGFSTTQVKYNSVGLTWSAVTGTAPVTYTLTRTDPGGLGSQGTAVFPGISATTFSDTNVYPNVASYNYQLQAVNGGGTGAPTTVVSATTPAAPWVASNGTTLTGGWLNSLAVDFNGVVYGTTGKLTDASSSGGVFKLSGSTWTAVNNGIPNGVVVTSVVTTGITSTVLYAATSGAGVFTSLDDGLTWNPVTSTGLTNANVRTLFVDSNGTLWAGGDAAGGGGIFNLPFGSTSWTPSLAGPTQSVQAFVEDPAPGTGNLWAQLGGGAASTPQGGLYVFSGGTWARDTTLSTTPADCSLVRPNASSLAIDTFGVSPLNPATLYWGSELCGLLSRTTTGTTWSTVAGYTATEITRVVVFDSGSGKQPFIWVASAEASAADGVTFIQNPGPTAVRMTNASFTNNWEPTALLFDSNKLYAGAGDGSGAYVSNNPTAGAGGNFTKTNNGLTNLKVSFVIRDSSSATNVFAASDQFGISSSTNAGATWATPQVPPGCTGSIASLAYDAGSTRLFATCQGVTGVFVASFAAATNALTWGAAPSACTGLNSSNFSSGIFVDTSTNPDTLYIATQGTPATIWTTAASGGGIANTCTALTPALPAAVTNVTAIAVDTNGAVYAGSVGNFVNTLCTTTSCKNANATWVAPTTGPKGTVRLFIDTQPNPDVIYAPGQGTGTGGVWSGAINGVGATTTITWATVPSSPTLVTSNSNVTAFNGFVTSGAPFLFAGTSFTAGQQYANVFRNGGAAWSASADGIIGGNLTSLTIPSASAIGSAVVLAGTTGAGIFKTSTGGQ